VNRSITGQGVRDTLLYLKSHYKDLDLKSDPSGKHIYDWKIPDEWNINNAYIITPDGRKIASFKTNNLHVVGYSVPINEKIEFSELKKHLHYIKDIPNAIPYVTSYYSKTWGFCITYDEFTTLVDGIYEVFIDSSLKPGEMNYGEIYLEGKSQKEIFLSTYICHPSMGNNEISGPVVTMALALWLKNKLKDRKFSYRIIFIPETIGSINYLHKNLDTMKRNIIAGFNINCVGGGENLSFLPSRNGQTLPDKVSRRILSRFDNVKYFSWLSRGSDERQYCSPKVDLPVVSIMRSKYGDYPEYHTSLDNLDFISEDGLQGSLEIYKDVIQYIESSTVPVAKHYCEPKLSNYNLFKNSSNANLPSNTTKQLLDILTFSDATNTSEDIADLLNIDHKACLETLSVLHEHNLVEFL